MENSKSGAKEAPHKFEVWSCHRDSMRPDKMLFSHPNWEYCENYANRNSTDQRPVCAFFHTYTDDRGFVYRSRYRADDKE